MPGQRDKEGAALPSCLSSTQMRPLCSSTTDMAITSPSPRPVRSRSLRADRRRLALLGRDAGAGVGNGDYHFAVAAGDSDVDAAAGRGVMLGDGEQIDDYRGAEDQGEFQHYSAIPY